MNNKKSQNTRGWNWAVALSGLCVGGLIGLFGSKTISFYEPLFEPTHLLPALLVGAALAIFGQLDGRFTAAWSFVMFLFSFIAYGAGLLAMEQTVVRILSDTDPGTIGERFEQLDDLMLALKQLVCISVFIGCATMTALLVLASSLVRFGFDLDMMMPEIFTVPLFCGGLSAGAAWFALSANPDFLGSSVLAIATFSVCFCLFFLFAFSKDS